VAAGEFKTGVGNSEHMVNNNKITRKKNNKKDKRGCMGGKEVIGAR